MNESKCNKCSGINETFQRGQYISGTRCLSCGYETFAKVCKTVGEVRLFMEKMLEDTHVVFQDDAASITLEAHFTGEIGKAQKIKVRRGLDK